MHKQIMLVASRLCVLSAALFALGSIGSHAQAQLNLYEQTLRVASFGGDYTRSQMLAHVRPWEAQTGKMVDMVTYGGGVNEIREQVNSANVRWDVVDMEYSDLIEACNEGLLEAADESILTTGSDGTPASEDIPQEYFHDCGYPSVVWSTVYAYNKAAFPDTAPSTIADFFNYEQFPGKRGLRRDPRGLLEWALIAEGVAPSDVYSVLSTPQGVQLAFDRATILKPHIEWWTSGGQPVEMLVNGTVAMASAWNGRLYRPIVENGQPLEIVWDGQLWEVEYWAIPKGSPRIPNAKDFIRFASQTQNLANITKHISYGPVRKSAAPLVDEQVKPYLPTSNMEGSLRVDSAWWAQNMQHLRASFEEWLEPKVSDIERNVRF